MFDSTTVTKVNYKKYKVPTKQSLVVLRLSLLEMKQVNWIQILDGVVCVLHGTNTFGKGMNPTIFSQVWVNSMLDWTI